MKFRKSWSIASGLAPRPTFRFPTLRDDLGAATFRAPIEVRAKILSPPRLPFPLERSKRDMAFFIRPPDRIIFFG